MYIDEARISPKKNAETKIFASINKKYTKREKRITLNKTPQTSVSKKLPFMRLQNLKGPSLLRTLIALMFIEAMDSMSSS